MIQPDHIAPSAPPIDLTDSLPAAPRRRSSFQRFRFIGLAALVLLIVLGIGLRSAAAPTAAPTAPSLVSVAPPVYTAHGQVRPAAEAKVGTIGGGVVEQITAAVGTVVGGQAEIARVRGPDGTTEIVTAPWRGTIADVLANVGDTVSPGATIAILDDLTQLQVETTDVDEFIVPHVRVGQTVTMTVEALDSLQITGRVRTVGIEPRLDTAGDADYPVVIDLQGISPRLKPGLTTDINFGE